MSIQAKNRTATVARMQSMIQGLQKHDATAQFTLESKAFTTTALVTLFQGVIDALNKATAAEAARTVAVAAAKEELAQADQVYTSLKHNLQGTYGPDAQTLGDFGLTPKKTPAPRTAAQKAASAAKRQSTREARGTKGTKQRAAIKGDVTGVVVTPVTGPAAPAPAAGATAPVQAATTTTK